MVVQGTFCQLCGLPTNHDHYVRTSDRMLKIYRSSAPGGGHLWEPDERPFPFTAQHEWLLDAVVLPWSQAKPVRGAIEDGRLGDVRAGDEADEGLPLHHACWAMQGEPATAQAAARANGSHAFAKMQHYHSQLFDLDSFAADGKAWQLADPRTDERSRARIAAMLASCRTPIPDRVSTIPVLIAIDRDWTGTALFDAEDRRVALLRARPYTIEAIDKTGYATLVRVTHRHDGTGLPNAPTMGALEAFELDAKASAERDEQAIMALVLVTPGRSELLFWSRDGAATSARLTQLAQPSGLTIDSTHDPDWNAGRELLQTLGQ